MAQVFAAGVLLFLILFFIGAYVPKKIKKIYLNNVDEMQNREYIDLSQVWHDASEEPMYDENIIAIDIDGLSVAGIFKDYNGNGIYRYHCFLCEWDSVVKWAYISDLLPKGGLK